MVIAKRLENEQGLLKQRILELRKSKQLTQKKLAEISGLSIRVVRRIEKGETNLEFKTILKLAMCLKVSLACLFDYKNQFGNRYPAVYQEDFDLRFSEEKEMLGNRILQMCKHRKIDQEELGILSSIASSDISLYIAGKENLVLLTLLKIAIGLEVDIADLFNYDGSMPNNPFIGKKQF